MHLNPLLARDSPCPELASCPVVSCAGQCNPKTESCTIVAQACPSTCSSVRCDPIDVSSGPQGPSPGALAGAVLGALIFLAFVVLGFFYYRKREAAKEAEARENSAVDVKPDIPARADAVLSRPDPHFNSRVTSPNDTEKFPTTTRAGSGDIRVYNNQSNTTINLDPSQQFRNQSGATSARSNPFADGASIQTASERSQSTNVIPIALVPPGSHSSDSQTQPHAGSSSRPAHSPDLSHRENPLDLEHVSMSDSEMGSPRLPYAGSVRTASGVSFMTTSSTTTDLDEAPLIMSPNQGVVRHVFGVSQAQVVRVPSSASASGSSPTLPTPTNAASRQPRSSFSSKMPVPLSKVAIGRSPLAQQSFTPGDIPLADREPTSPMSTSTLRGDPFTDAASPNNRASFADSSRTTDTLGSPTEFHSEGPFTPRPGATFADAQDSRPVSTASKIDGVSIRADINTASRVILGMQSPTAYGGSTLSPFGLQSRATSTQTSGGRTVVSVDHDDDEHSGRRHSLVSAKTTSSRADSVLAAFPFVPPSPISSLPPRSPGSPGNSPAAAGSMFARQQQIPSGAAHNTPASPSSPTSSVPATVAQRPPPSQRAPLPPIPKSTPDRDAKRAEATLSTSTTSGLETYPFQFGGAPAIPDDSVRGSRASLDTLALSRDVAAFPIEGSRVPMNQRGPK